MLSPCSGYGKMIGASIDCIQEALENPTVESEKILTFKREDIFVEQLTIHAIRLRQFCSPQRHTFAEPQFLLIRTFYSASSVSPW